MKVWHHTATETKTTCRAERLFICDVSIYAAVTSFLLAILYAKTIHWGRKSSYHYFGNISKKGNGLLNDSTIHVLAPKGKNKDLSSFLGSVIIHTRYVLLDQIVSSSLPEVEKTEKTFIRKILRFYVLQAIVSIQHQ